MFNNPSILGPIANLPKFTIFLLLAWTLVWKGIALWKSARNKQKYWFIALFILNTAGILPIIYLAFFKKKKK